MPAPIAEWLTEGVSLSLAGRAWRLIVTHGVLLDCQAESGIDVLSGLNALSPPAKALQSLLWALLKRDGFQGTARAVGSMVTLRALPRIRAAVSRAWIASMPDPDPTAPAREKAAPLTWIDLWSIAHENLKIASEEWLAMTPRMVAALQARRLERLQREELLTGIIAATSANFSFCRPDHALTPESFMLHKLPERERKVLDGDELAAAFMSRN